MQSIHCSDSTHYRRLAAWVGEEGVWGRYMNVLVVGERYTNVLAVGGRYTNGGGWWVGDV